MNHLVLTSAQLRSRAELRHVYETTSGAEGRAEDLLAIACEGADLSGLALCGVVAVDSSLPGASFRDADLSLAVLARLVAPRANFDGATLVKADMVGAQLAHSSFVGAKMFKANLRGADLRDADLRSVTFNDADLRGARTDGARIEPVHHVRQRTTRLRSGPPLTRTPRWTSGSWAHRGEGSLRTRQPG